MMGLLTKACSVYPYTSVRKWLKGRELLPTKTPYSFTSPTFTPVPLDYYRNA